MEVTARYPEFQPSGATTVPEQVSDLERDIAYAGILSWGNQVMADDQSDVVRLQHLLSELTTIPATERLYGEEAIQLADKARRRLRELVENGPQPPEEPEELAVVEVNDLADVVASPESAEDVVEGPSPEALEAIEAARSRADELYRTRAFSSAAARLQEVAETLPEGEEREALESDAASLVAFEASFSEARRLARKQGDHLQRAEALEKAMVLDGKLAGKYVSELRRELADVLVNQATADFEAQRYAIAREHLDRARGHDRSAREVARLSTLFAFRGASLLRAANEATDLGQKRRLAEYAQLLAVSGSALHKESTALLATLGGEAQ
jgi:tetratricopeptide (TPR) repeat protein